MLCYYVISKDIVAPVKESSNNGNCGQLFRPYWGSSAQCTDDELPHEFNRLKIVTNSDMKLKVAID